MSDSETALVPSHVRAGDAWFEMYGSDPEAQLPRMRRFALLFGAMRSHLTELFPDLFTPLPFAKLAQLTVLDTKPLGSLASAVSEAFRHDSELQRLRTEEEQALRARLEPLRLWLDFEPEVVAEMTAEGVPITGGRLTHEDWVMVARFVQLDPRRPGVTYRDIYNEFIAFRARRSSERRLNAAAIALALSRLLQAVPAVSAQPAEVSPTSPAPSDAPMHAADFNWVRCSLGEFKFQGRQRQIIEGLWRDWEAGGLGLSLDHFRTSGLLGKKHNFAGVFKGADAWRKLVVPTELKDVVKLALPAPPRKNL